VDAIWMIVMIVLLELVLPLSAVVWVANGRSRSRTHLALKTAAAAAVVSALYVGGVWSSLSFHLRPLFVALFLAAAAHAWWRARRLDWRLPTGRGGWAAAVVAFAVLGVFGYLLSQVVGAGRVPPGAVELGFPFESGTFMIAHGGSRPMMNAHMSVRSPTARGQRYALDIVRIDGLGRRARRLYPSDPARYRIFGTPVIAPCAGSVVATLDGLPDHRPPAREPDLSDAAGNHVQIRCDPGFYAVLAHLARGSVAVEPGQRIGAGDRVGLVGNSGNTSEPHLHVNAQSGPGDRFILDADPLPIVFVDHGFLRRNDVVRLR
jgi:hypothetical protein